MASRTARSPLKDFKRKGDQICVLEKPLKLLCGEQWWRHPGWVFGSRLGERMVVVVQIQTWQTLEVLRQYRTFWGEGHVTVSLGWPQVPVWWPGRWRWNPSRWTWVESGLGGSFTPCPCSSGLVSCSHSFSHHLLQTKSLTSLLVSLSAPDSTWPKPWTSLHQNTYTEIQLFNKDLVSTYCMSDSI